MRNIRLMMKYELITILSKPSFWVMTVLFPLFLVGLNIGTQIMVHDRVEGSRLGQEQLQDQKPVGYVDEAGLISRFPEQFPADSLIAYPTEAAAQDALRRGEVGSYVFIPAGYIESGELTVVQAEFDPMGATPDFYFEQLLAYNIAGDPAVAETFSHPVSVVESRRLAPVEAESGGAGGSGPMAFIVPYAVLFILFIMITMSGSYMLQSVSREKENRTVEVLLLSINPRQMMFGKILGLSVVALLQMALWLGGGMLGLGNIGAFVESVTSVNLPASFLVWALLFFLLGYLLYASLLGAVGALAPSAQEGGQLTFIVLLPLMIPLWLNQTLLMHPNSLTAQIFSLIPFTAPLTMLTRMAATSVPVWQTLLSLAGLALVTYGMIVLAARFFRADTLLSYDPVKKERILKALRG